MAPKQKTTYRKYSEESLHKALDAIKGKFLIQKSLYIKHWMQLKVNFFQILRNH